MHGHHDEAGSRQEKAARKKEVTALFINLSDDEANDITELSCVLTSRDIMTNMLEMLEAAVAKKTQEKLELSFANMSPAEQRLGKLTVDEFLDRDEKHWRHKILSDVLYQWAIENGMAKTEKKGRGEFLRFNRLLGDGNEFLAHIKQGHLFKDRGTPTSSHGVWSHFIQWYVIIEHFKSLKSTSPLNEPILTLYKMLGDPAKCMSRDKKLSLWFWLCDDNNSSKSTHDFRSPDRLHAFILGNDEKFKFLSRFVQYDENIKAHRNPHLPHTTTSTYDPVTGKKTPWK